jgi:hypothetical protein
MIQYAPLALTLLVAACGRPLPGSSSMGASQGTCMLGRISAAAQGHQGHMPCLEAARASANC